MAKSSRTEAKTPAMPRESRLLMELIHANEIDIFRKLLKRAKYRNSTVLNGEEMGGDWPMAVAARSGKLKFVKALRHAGASVTRTSSDGTRFTALSTASFHPHVQDYLRRHGA